MVAVGIQPTETRAIQNLVVLISGQIRKLRLREGTPTLAQGHKRMGPGAASLGRFCLSHSRVSLGWAGDGGPLPGASLDASFTKEGNWQRGRLLNPMRVRP